MKHLSIIFIFTFIFNIYSQGENPSEWTNFTIYVNASESPLFKEMNNDLGLGIMDKDELDMEYNRGRYGDYVLGGRYQVLVNLTEENPMLKYMVVGDYDVVNLEKDARAMRFSWAQLSKKTQDALLMWNKDNKINNVNRVFPESKEDPNDPRTWTYFKILARAEDDSVFIRIQEDMGIDPMLESYSMTINVSDSIVTNQYLVLGDETDPSAQRYYWNQISQRNQEGLLKWTGSNKENLNYNRNYFNNKVELYSELIKINPKYRKLYYIYFLRGQANSRTGNYEAAIKDLNKSIELNDEFSKAYYERGNVYNTTADYKKAMNNYNKALEFDTDNGIIYGKRAETNMYLKKYNNAISDYEQAIKLAPDSYYASSYKWNVQWIKDYYLKK